MSDSEPVRHVEATKIRKSLRSASNYQPPSAVQDEDGSDEEVRRLVPSSRMQQRREEDSVYVPAATTRQRRGAPAKVVIETNPGSTRELRSHATPVPTPPAASVHQPSSSGRSGPDEDLAPPTHAPAPAQFITDAPQAAVEADKTREHRPRAPQSSNLHRASKDSAVPTLTGGTIDPRKLHARNEVRNGQLDDEQARPSTDESPESMLDILAQSINEQTSRRLPYEVSGSRSAQHDAPGMILGEHEIQDATARVRRYPDLPDPPLLDDTRSASQEPEHINIETASVSDLQSLCRQYEMDRDQARRDALSLSIACMLHYDQTTHESKIALDSLRRNISEGYLKAKDSKAMNVVSTTRRRDPQKR